MPKFRSSAAYRISITTAAVAGWGLLVLALAVFFVADAKLRNFQDREITQEVADLSHEPSRAELLREINSREDGPGNGLSYALFDPSGNRIAGTLDISPPPPGLASLSIRGADGEEHVRRALTANLQLGNTLVVVGDSSRIAEARWLIVKVFVIALVVLLLGSVVGCLLLASYLRRRLSPITATASAIISGDIEWRVPVRDPGDEFDAAGRTFNLMLERIAGLMENLRQVSSDIAHDLRKPLIRLLCQTDRLGQVDGAEQRVLDIGDEMLELFAAILRIAEVEGGNVERSFKPVDLSALMSEVAESFEPPLTDAGDTIAWEIEPDIVVMGNYGLLTQLAANLLDNARIHTPPGTAIRLTLATEASQALLSVEDNGPGVSEADAKQLLQRFFRAETSRTTPGNGLGLSLVAAATRAHGGEVSIENAEPGLRISIRLPKLGEISEPEKPSSLKLAGLFANWFQ